MNTLLRGPGFLICRAFKNNSDAEGARIVGIGLLFCVVLIAGAFLLYGDSLEILEVDRCLDAGGAYDYQIGECVFH